MLDINTMIKSAEECLGWPYVNPGTNDARGIDCSGLFVKMYRDQGKEIYHGSNTIFRKYCSGTGKLTAVKQLVPGMAVFKRKDWTDDDKNNKWYGTDPGNISHIGFVISVRPLRIIHASTDGMVVKTDTKLGKWAYWGKLKDVDYGNSEEVVVSVEYMFVNTTSGSLNMRSAASSGAGIVARIPRGEKVAVIEKKDSWCKITYGEKTGYVMASFLSETAPEGNAAGEKITLTITKECATTLYEALKYSLKL